MQKESQFKGKFQQHGKGCSPLNATRGACREKNSCGQKQQQLQEEPSGLPPILQEHSSRISLAASVKSASCSRDLSEDWNR